MFAGAHWTLNGAAGLGFLNKHRDVILRCYGDSLDISAAQENTWTPSDTDVASGSRRKSGKSDTQTIVLSKQENNLLIMTTSLLLKTQHLILLLTVAAGLLRTQIWRDIKSILFLTLQNHKFPDPGWIQQGKCPWYFLSFYFPFLSFIIYSYQRYDCTVQRLAQTRNYPWCYKVWTWPLLLKSRELEGLAMWVKMNSPHLIFWL